MDYTEQIEKLFKYFDLSLNLDEIRIAYKIKYNMDNDFNILASFLKDFLTCMNNKNIENNCIFSETILWLNQDNLPVKDKLNELLEYSKFYRIILFEEIDDKKILYYLSTINECYAVYCYPNLLDIFNEYYKSTTAKINVYKKLAILTDFVIKNYNSDNYNILDYNIINNALITQEREVV